MGEIIIIAVYGFLKNFCPDGFYMSNILLGPEKNFTQPETTQEVYPVLVYSNLVLTLVALLITDILQYKTLIVVGAFASLAAKALLFWGTSIVHIQAMQVLYAAYRASQVAYRTYVYTKVQKHNYQRVTAVVHITPKVGTLVSALIAQSLLCSRAATLHNLMQIAFVGLALAALATLLLPSVEGTAYSPDPGDPRTHSARARYARAAKLLWQELRAASTNADVVKWCVWWVLATGAMQLVSDYYVQALWNDISGEKQTTYNAGVEAVYATLSSVVCYWTGRLRINWTRHGEAVFAVCTLAMGFALLHCANTTSVLLSYAVYVSVSTLYDMLMVVSNSQVALQVKNDSFGFIFGINTFLSLVFQSLLTYILTSKNTFALPIRHQFVAIAGCVLVLGLGCALKATLKFATLKRRVGPEKICGGVAPPAPAPLPDTTPTTAC